MVRLDVLTLLTSRGNGGECGPLPMKFFRRAKEPLGEAIQKMAVPGRKERTFVENLLRVPLHTMGDARSYLEVGSKRVWASFRACHITANVVLSTVFKIQGEQTGAEVNSPELSRLMLSPNPYDSWEEVLYQWVFHMKLCGDAYWVKDQMNGRGQPLHLYPLIPQYVRVIPDEKTMVAGYEYQVNGKLLRFAPNEIIHFRRPHPAKIIMGMGDVEPSADLYKDYITRGTLEQKFLGNGAMPSGVLTKEEEVSDEGEWKKIKEWWKREYEGERNAGKTAFLNGKWNYIKLGLTQGEMQSLEKEKWSVEQIFLNHGVPLSVAGIEGAANYATAKQDDINFRTNEVVPLLDILVGKLNATGPDGAGLLVKAFSPAWVMAYQLSGLINVGQAATEYKPLVEMGAMSLNEYREVCGLERKKDPLLDQHFVPSGRVPLEMAGLTDTTAGGTAPGSEPEPPKPPPPPKEPGQEPKEPAEPKEPEE